MKKPDRENAGPDPLKDSLEPSFDLSRARWEQEYQENRGRAWRDSPETRFAIRMFSRGVLGATGFAFGGWYARRATGLAGYSPESWNKSKPLHWAAKFFDTFAGKPIKAVVNAFGYDGERAVRFRATGHDFQIGKTGRTLGEEVVGVSTDFSFMSWFDALGRDICDIADPNVKKEWIREDGSMDSGKALKGMGKALWRYTTYNAGEDWAVGLPYVYWMKGTRHLWNKAYPGFKYDFDRGLNGGSFMVNRNGELTGNYQLAGLLNLQERFTAYNIGTLMYREAYDYVSHRLKGENVALYGPLDAPEKADGIAGHLGRLAKWGARSAIKGSLYMTPVVPFFWITRTPQSKYKGRFINPNDESILNYHYGGRFEGLHANEFDIQKGKPTPAFHSGTPVVSRTYTGPYTGWMDAPNPYRHPLSSGRFDAYKRTFGPIDAGLNAIGKVSDVGRRQAEMIPGRLSLNIAKADMARAWNAAVAYTPYMWAKAEAAKLWDTGKMDVAAERVVDGAFDFNWGEFRAGCSEVMRAVMHQPFSDPKREWEAQHRSLLRTTPADETFLEPESAQPYFTKGFADRIRKQKEQYGPQTRVLFAGAPKSYTDRIQQTDNSYAEQHAMRKLLEETAPPTPSVH